MPTKLPNLRYICCTLPELERFVLERKLAIPHSTIEKKTKRRNHKTANRKAILASVLHAADRRPLPPFRFFDFSAELRNAVYEDLLTLDDGQHGFPQILAASKAVYTEASGLLYSINEIRMLLGCSPYSSSVFLRSISSQRIKSCFGIIGVLLKPVLSLVLHDSFTS